jgi:uncharacterized protein YjbI with pentapeptide repeats
MNESKKLELLIREAKQEEFNEYIKSKGEPADLEGADLRNLNLSGFNLKGANLKDSYLRNSDLCGVDLREANLNGTSIKNAKISGAFFPQQVAASEILLSLQYGSKIRMT